MNHQPLGKTAARVPPIIFGTSCLGNLHEASPEEAKVTAGPDVVIEAVGLGGFAGRVVYIGYAKKPVEYDTKYFVMKELDILGSRNATPRDFQSGIQMLERGQFPVDAVIAKTVSLAEVGAALQARNNNPAAFTKIHVEMS